MSYPQFLTLFARRSALAAAILATAASAFALDVEQTLCEHLRDPHGIDTPAPRLTWRLSSDVRGDRQTAYQVLVATSPGRLQAGEADAWDSGKVESDRSVLVPYRGRDLESHEHHWWKVRVWDHRGEPSEWSEPAEWLTGVLDDAQWDAEWIGIDVPDRTSHLSQASWIWHPKDDDAPFAAPIGRRYFRRGFNLSDTPVQGAVLRITGDDHVEIFLNGRRLGTRSGPNSTKELDVTNLLRPGRNVLAVRGENRGDEPNPAGVIAWMRVDHADGEHQTMVSDGDWLAAAEEHPGWEAPDFDDSGWQAARVLGEVNCEPWGPVRYAEDRTLAARNLRREFTLDKPVERAIVSWCGLGASDLFANGAPVGDHVLSPAMSQYPERAYYLTRDVTDQLRQGRNVLACLLGNGRFYSPRSEVYAGMPSYGPPMLLLRLTVTHPDGSTTVVTSDRDWRVTDQGPIVANNEYDGEEYDARRELGDWRAVGYDESDWREPDELDSPTERLQAEPIAPMRVTQTIEPVSIDEPRPGVFVFEFGQNLVGVCRLKVSGPAGTTVRLRHAERLTDDGELYLENLRGAKNTDRYTLKGGGQETWTPRFTLHGFRYAELTGYPGEPTPDSLEALVVHDDLEPVGRFECGNDVINRVYQNARWGFRGNYRTVPLDCPQRDERQGWLGDRLETARSESYAFNVAAFYEKWLADVRDSQKPNGSLPDIAPIHWPRFSDNVVWPSTSILAPGILYEQYGDLRPIREQYDCNAKWVEHMAGYLRDDGLIARDSYGDWCVPPEAPHLIHTEDPARITDTTLLASAFFYYDLTLLEEHAKLLGRTEDARRWGQMAADLRDAVNRVYYDAEAGQYDNGTQTSSVLPLAFGLPPSGERNELATTLARHVAQRDGGAIATGLVGGQFLCRTLTDIGRPDLAYAIASRSEYPSWGYMADQGATTIWELWNGDTADPAMNSGNHVMLVGDLVTWLYEDLAGIAADPAAPGFERIVMRPQPVDSLPWARASLVSPHGRIESDWRKENGRFRWRVLVPPGSTAEVHLPTDDAEKVTVDGDALDEIEGVTVTGVRDGRVVLEAVSGRFEFAVEE
ncbi:family 78 glycoside hydrolase catalytic domain [Botrimarina sp.]|uniref:family 78 glycoside hydrolase catalytic domain n=1 Tax=Botrimarina sp. TaxID=2795802 RepID=UPI0032EABD6D